MAPDASFPLQAGQVGAFFSEPCTRLPQVQERFLADGNDRLKLVVLLCGEDDDKLQNAAAGALAMLTAAHKKLCFKMTQVVRAGPRDSGESPHPQPTLPCMILWGGGQPLYLFLPLKERRLYTLQPLTLIIWTP